MRRAFKGLRERKPLFASLVALDTVLISLVMSGLGATPAQAANPPGAIYNTVTQTGWLPLACNLDAQAGTFNTGIPVHLGVVLTQTMPASVTPGQTFAITNVTSYQDQPPAAQFAANSFNANYVAGTVSDFEVKITNGKGAFNAPDDGSRTNPDGSALVNQVRAYQPTNIDTPNPLDPLQNPDGSSTSTTAPGTGNGTPSGDWWASIVPAVPYNDSRRIGVFTFGAIPIDTSGAPGVQTAYGPTPGTGGGPSLTSGTPDPLKAIYPFQVSQSAPVGGFVTLDAGDHSRIVTLSDVPTWAGGDLVAIANAFFHNVTTNTWEAAYHYTPCGYDTSTAQVANPCPTVGPGCPNAYITGGFKIPIVAAQGLLRVTSNPAVPTQILVDGNITDSWGLVWMKESAGSHTVCFAHVDGWTEPPCQTVTVSNGATTTVTGNFTQRGSLRVLNSPAVASAISVDGNPTNEYGMWTDIPTGPHTVCWGAVAGWTPPPCQSINLTTAGLTVTGNFTACGGCTGQSGVGLLRVTANAGSQITLKAGAGPTYIADHWALTWLEVPGGSYTVCFSHVIGWTEPPCSTVTVTNGATTTVTGTLTQRGFLRVLTTAGTPATIYVNDIPRNDWGDWTDYPTGTYTVCYGAAASYGLTPPCVSAVVTAGATTTITGTYH